MIKVLVGVVIGFLLFQSPVARQYTADVLRQGADLLDPPSKVVPKGVTDAIMKTLSPNL
jgi:hypothetical protein